MQPRRVFVLLSLALWLSAVLGVGVVQAREVRVGVYTNKPKIFLDAAGTPTGIFIDILQRIAEREDWSLTYVPCTWQACLDSLQAGSLDLMPDVAISTEREQLYDFHTTPVLSSWSVVFAAKGVQINSIFDLANKRVAVLGGSIQERIFPSLASGFGVTTQLIQAQSFDEAFALVSAGKADAAIANNLYGEFHAPEHQLRETAVVFQPSRLYFAVKRGTNPELLQAIDRHLTAWQAANGSEYFQVLSKWRGKSPEAVVPDHIWQAGVALTLLLLLAAAAAFVLRWQIKVQTRHLAAETARVQALLDAIPDLLFEVDLAGFIHSYHSPRTDLLAAPPEVFLGHDFTEILPPEVAELCLAGIREADEVGYSVGKQYALQLADGEHFFELSISRKQPAKGQSARFIFLARDITTRKRAEEVLAKHNEHLSQLVDQRTAALTLAKDAAEAANRAKSTFLATMSHELRTPMTAIMGMVDLVLRKSTDPKQIDQLGKAQRASQHLLAVINNILDISKIEAERLTLESLHFKLGEVLENLVSLIGPKASEKGIRLQVDLPSEIVAQAYLGDPLRLGQILLNFAGNALKFTEQGSITVRVRRLEDTSSDSLLRWEVVDTGIGIAPDDQPRLFTAFEQADGSTTRKYGGSGLGLVISLRLARLMGGDVGVISALGAGSTFWFTVRLAKDGATRPLPSVVEPGHAVPNQGHSIPHAGSAVPPASTPVMADAETRLQTEFAGARILLAEDEPVSREVSQGMLEDAGLLVDTAADGAQALALAKQRRYAAILMDMQMPVMNGIDATVAIRRDSLNSATPILAMTANAFDTDRQDCLAAGMNDHIAKPVSHAILFATLVTWLSKPPEDANTDLKSST
jgi:PAS domain S-box-containing protein